MSASLFIFDWDGTLCDSTATIIRTMHLAGERCELAPLTDAQVMNIIGLGLPQAIRHLYPGLSAAGIEQVCATYSETYRTLNQQPPTLFPGVRETLQALHQAGHQLAVATSKTRAGLQRVLDGLGASDWFHASRCADETASKPDPLMLHQLLAELRVPVERALMVGDTEYDMEMANRAGMRRVAVDYGAHALPRLQAWEPVLSVSRIDQILALA